MSTRLVISVSPSGSISVASNDRTVQVVLLRAEEGPAILVKGEPVTLDGLSEGLPHYRPEDVEETFVEVGHQLASATGRQDLPQEVRTRLGLANTAWFSAGETATN